jgi:uncharacterized membrane protein HdeD (DUF308 family)
MAHVAPTYAGTAEATFDVRSDYWWVLLITGSLWSLFGLVVFRFDYTSVAAMAVLLGTVCIAASVLEFMAAFNSHGWGRVGRIAFALALGIVGVVAYVHPGNTFTALSAVFAFYLLFRGVFDIIIAIAAHGVPLWWVTLLSGIVQVLLAFWAAGDFGHKAFLLVVWVGASALAHGIVEIVTAFRLKPQSS